MADEKLNTGQEQTEQPSLFDTGPEVPAPEPTVKALEQTTVETDGAPGGVVVSAEQIEKLMAERNAAARAEVEKKEPPEPEQPPAPAPKEKTTGEKPPAKKEKAAEEKTPTPEEKPKGRRGRKPKKEAPAAPPPAPEQPPQPRDATRAEKEEIVYLNLSELFPFKDHPFGVRDDAEMKGLVESVKDNGVHQPALVRPREGGGYEIIAGHRRQRASELAGFANMPCLKPSPILVGWAQDEDGIWYADYLTLGHALLCDHHNEETPIPHEEFLYMIIPLVQQVRRLA